MIAVVPELHLPAKARRSPSGDHDGGPKVTQSERDVSAIPVWIERIVIGLGDRPVTGKKSGISSRRGFMIV
jgi:hypothetical protein